jgi:hypothetical protein
MLNGLVRLHLVRFASFNQDFSCVSVGTKKGYQIINTDPFGRVYSKSKACAPLPFPLSFRPLVPLSLILAVEGFGPDEHHADASCDVRDRVDV